MNLLLRILAFVGRAWRDRAKRAVMISAVATMAIAILLDGPPYFTNGSIAPRTGSPVLDLELVETQEQARLILGEAPSTDRETMRLKTRIDFAFVLAYALLFVSAGWVLARRGGWRRLVSLAGSFCGLAAAVFDVLENRAILAILDLPMRQISQAALDAIRQPALAKWSLAGAGTVCLLAVLLAGRNVPQGMRTAPGS